MRPVPEIDLAELVEECIPIARREFAIKLQLEKIWANYWARISQEKAEEARMKRYQQYTNKHNISWMRSRDGTSP